jgi:hypothetical protein
LPFWAVAKAMCVFTAQPLIWDENIASRAVHAAAAIGFVVI